MNRSSATFPSLISAIAIALLPGCAAPSPAPRGGVSAARDPFAGRWVGAWHSTKSAGEGGRLRCDFTPLGGGQYAAAFHANWKVFATDYTAQFSTRRHGAQLWFKGTHQLPSVFGGLYRFEGEATPQRFTATYSSSYDEGMFEMTRPK